MKWAIFCSGWGRSAATLIKLFEQNNFVGALVDTIICTGQNTQLTNEKYKHNYYVVDESPEKFTDRIAWQEVLKSRLKDRQIDYIFLCGFKYRIHSPLLEAFPERIVNIHPSLLPSFKNTQNAIREAIDLGVEVTGITTHFIDDKIDEGIIICQEPVKIEGLSFKEVDKKFTEKCPLILKRTIQKIHSFSYNKMI